MRCEKPWSASFGTTANARIRAVVTRTSDATARAGSETRATSFRLLGDHVLEGGPAEQPEEHVVEREQGQVAARIVHDARPDAPDHDRDRERKKEERQEEISGAGDDRRPGDERADR